MSDNPTSAAYLHGFSPVEQARLIKQARLLESTIFNSIDYTGVKQLLEVGSGVGAQTEILLRRFPDLRVTCVDLNEPARRGAAEPRRRCPGSRIATAAAGRRHRPAVRLRASSMPHSCAGCWSMCPRPPACSTRSGACSRRARRSTSPK
jgi:hypothetical protein